MFNVIEVKALLSLPRGLNLNIILEPLSKPLRPGQRTEQRTDGWREGDVES